MKLNIIISGFKSFLRPIKHKLYDKTLYEWLYYNSEKKNQKLLNNLKTKSKLKVVFLVSEVGKWKVDPVFKKMMGEDCFEPCVVAVPFANLEAEQRAKKIEDTVSYFSSIGYPVYSALDESGNFISFSTFDADLVFFSEPYNLTKNEKYYSDIFFNYLSFYIPYFFMATSHVRSNPLKFHGIPYKFFLSMWRIYWPHNEIQREFEIYDGRVASKNSVVTGYPAVEGLFAQASQKLQEEKLAWPIESHEKIKIIYAPHHTVLDDLPNLSKLSTFIELGEAIKEMAIRYKDEVHWSFKPHPTLKLKLYQHPDWGVERTNNYYSFWKEQEFTQIDMGTYEDLFLQSDSIIHDCSSFIVEYAFTNKPCLYLTNENTYDILNSFGKSVFDIYETADSIKQVEAFIESLINNRVLERKVNMDYFQKYVKDYYINHLPSELIVNDLKQSLGF